MSSHPLHHCRLCRKRPAFATKHPALLLMHYVKEHGVQLVKAKLWCEKPTGAKPA